MKEPTYDCFQTPFFLLLCSYFYFHYRDFASNCLIHSKVPCLPISGIFSWFFISYTSRLLIWIRLHCYISEIYKFNYLSKYLWPLLCLWGSVFFVLPWASLARFPSVLIFVSWFCLSFCTHANFCCCLFDFSCSAI